MGFQAVNIADVEERKTGQGMSQFLVKPQSREDPDIMIRCWGPETDLGVHSHPYNEMFFVLEGEVIMGEQTYGAGSCIYISANTPYGPTRAPKGAKLLRYAEAKRPEPASS
jgi:mannose-6-phosphate isomerase-like protein (cupin superfamily)